MGRTTGLADFNPKALLPSMQKDQKRKEGQQWQQNMRGHLTDWFT